MGSWLHYIQIVAGVLLVALAYILNPTFVNLKSNRKLAVFRARYETFLWIVLLVCLFIVFVIAVLR